MKMNLQSLMNLISEEEKNLNNNYYLIKEHSLNTSIEELDGKINVIEDNKQDFDFELEEIEKISKKLSKLKSILYKKNNEFRLKDGRNIQEALTDNTNLRKLKSCYEELLYSKNIKKRYTEVNNSYFECKTINFDREKVKKRLEEIDEKIKETDFELSKLNSIEFEI